MIGAVVFLLVVCAVAWLLFVTLLRLLVDIIDHIRSILPRGREEARVLREYQTWRREHPSEANAFNDDE